MTERGFTPDGRTLVTAGDDGDAIVLGRRAGRRRPRRSRATPTGAALQITGDGRTLYTAASTARSSIWDLAGTRRLGRPFDAGAPNRGRARSR